MIKVAVMKMSGIQPRVHGNGFIQYDFDNVNRLHIWHPDVPRQKVSTPIHDHVFGFKSRIITGRLLNVVYRFVPQHHGDFRIYKPMVREGEDTVLEATSVTGRVEPFYTQMLKGNTTMRTYQMRPFIFHESIAPDGVAATMITKDSPTQAQGGATPRVLVPIDVVPDNDFNRYDHDEELLWSIIEQTLKERTR